MMPRCTSALIAALIAVVAWPAIAQERPVLGEIVETRAVALERPVTFSALSGPARGTTDTVIVTARVVDLMPFLLAASGPPAFVVNGALAEVVRGPFLDGTITLMAPAPEPGAGIEVTSIRDGYGLRLALRDPEAPAAALPAEVLRDAPVIRLEMPDIRPVDLRDIDALRDRLDQNSGRLDR
jgi:hypothetical protein